MKHLPDGSLAFQRVYFKWIATISFLMPLVVIVVCMVLLFPELPLLGWLGLVLLFGVDGFIMFSLLSRPVVCLTPEQIKIQGFKALPFTDIQCIKRGCAVLDKIKGDYIGFELKPERQITFKPDFTQRALMKRGIPPFVIVLSNLTKEDQPLLLSELERRIAHEFTR